MPSIADFRFNLKLRKDQPFDVVGMGLNAVDHLCVAPNYPAFNTKVKISEFRKMGGGQVATAMAECAQLGMRAKYVGKVGSDDLGEFSLESLRNLGIDISGVTVEPDSYNQYAFIIIDSRNGERTILWDRDPKLMYRPGELRREEVIAGAMLHLDGHDLKAAIQSSQWAREAGMPVCLDIDRLDPDIGRLLPNIDFLISSTNFPLELTRGKDIHKALLKLQEITSGFVCATLGAEGALSLLGGEFYYSPGFAVEAVDTTGAGDVYHGAFLFGLWKNWPLDSILHFANAAAALNCVRLGARGGLSTAADVFAFIQSRGVIMDATSGRVRKHTG